MSNTEIMRAFFETLDPEERIKIEKTNPLSKNWQRALSITPFDKSQSYSWREKVIRARSPKKISD